MTTDLSRAQWRKSRHSGMQNCVEVAAFRGAIAIRDSKNPDDPALIFTTRQIHAFLNNTKKNRFDLAKNG